MDTVIINENAGGGSMADTFRRIEHRLVDAIGDFDLQFTDRSGHAIELTREAIRGGAKRVIVGGGDGTVNEAVNGFFDEDGNPLNGDTALAFLPGGTGGDFRKTLGITNVETALRTLQDPTIRTLDVGRLSFREDDGTESQRFFVNIASFGLSGRVDRLVPRFSALPGQLAYFAATAFAMWDHETPTVSLKVGEHFEAELPITAVAVANGCYFGGGMKIAPEAKPDDGHFDVTVLSGMGRLELMGLTKGIYDGSHLNDSRVLSERGSVVTASSDSAVPLDIDGEPLGWLPARFEVVPGVLPVQVPGSSSN